ncbi:MAG: hypothetical protein AB9907_04010 [Flexilinea sp.]
MKKSGTINNFVFLSAIFLCLAAAFSAVNQPVSVQSDSADQPGQNTITEIRKVRSQVIDPNSIVIENFVVKTLQAKAVDSVVLEPTAASTNTPAAVSAGPLVLWRPTSTPDRSVEIVPTDEYVTSPEYSCNVTVNSPYYFQQFSFGEDFDLDVTFTNTGTKEWDTDIDVMQYTGMRIEVEGKYLYDLDKDYDSALIVYPGQSIHWKIRMEAPQEQFNDTNKYFATYNLIRSRSADLANGIRDEDEDGMFCPFSFYIYVPPQ